MHIVYNKNFYFQFNFFKFSITSLLQMKFLDDIFNTYFQHPSKYREENTTTFLQLVF